MDRVLGGRCIACAVSGGQGRVSGRAAGGTDVRPGAWGSGRGPALGLRVPVREPAKRCWVLEQTRVSLDEDSLGNPGILSNLRCFF